MNLIFCLWISCNMQIDPTAASALYDREVIDCSLDLLSGLVEALGGIESLVSSSPHGCVLAHI
jgi:hypothetical protein